MEFNVISSFENHYKMDTNNHLPENFELCCYYLMNNLYFSCYDLPNYNIINWLSKVIRIYGYNWTVKQKFKILRTIILMTINNSSIETCLKFVNSKFSMIDLFKKKSLSHNDILKVKYNAQTPLARLIKYFNNIGFGYEARLDFDDEQMFFIYDQDFWGINSYSPILDIYYSIANISLINTNKKKPIEIFSKYHDEALKIATKYINQCYLIDYDMIRKNKSNFHNIIIDRAKKISTTINEYLVPIDTSC